MLRSTRASNARNLASISYYPRHRRFSQLLPTINTKASRISDIESDTAVLLLSVVRISRVHDGRSIPKGGKSFYSTTTTTRMPDGKENGKGATANSQTLDSPPPPPSSSPHSNPSTTGKQKSMGVQSSLTPRRSGDASSMTNRTSKSPSSSPSSQSRTNEGTVPQTDTSTHSSSVKPLSQSTISTVHRPRSTPHLVIPKTPENLGIVKTALNDIEDAMSNGTLKPVPPDLAARLKKAAEGDAMATSGVDTVQVWWHRLKEMTKFYFFGIVALGREHRVRAKEIRTRLKESESKGIRGVQEWRWNDFLQTYRMDVMRLVPFVSIIIVLEEILPLIIIYAPFLLPSTCKLPSQAKRIAELADQKRWDALIALRDILKRGGYPEDVSKTATESRLDRLPEGSLPLVCRLLGIAPYGPSPYLKARVRSTLASLSQEDSYFQSNSSSSSSSDPVSHLSLSELRLLLRRRGFPTSPLSLPQLRDNLTWWLAQPEHQMEKRLAALVALARSSSGATPTPTSPSSPSSSGRA